MKGRGKGERSVLLDNVGVVVDATVHGSDDEESGGNVSPVQRVDESRGPGVWAVVEGDGDGIGNRASLDEGPVGEVGTSRGGLGVGGGRGGDGGGRGLLRSGRSCSGDTLRIPVVDLGARVP